MGQMGKSDQSRESALFVEIKAPSLLSIYVDDKVNFPLAPVFRPWRAGFGTIQGRNRRTPSSVSALIHGHAFPSCPQYSCCSAAADYKYST